jgi:hypothetical protein
VVNKMRVADSREVAARRYSTLASIPSTSSERPK